MRQDGSLSGLLLGGRSTVSLLNGLAMPSRYLWTQDVERLTVTYGPTAVRLWLLVLSDSAIIYSTNPSTLAVFLEEIEHDWTGSTRLLRESAAHPVGARAGDPPHRVTCPRFRMAASGRPRGYGLARLMTGAAVVDRQWDTQFKLLPLYARRWGELGLPAMEEVL